MDINSLIGFVMIFGILNFMFYQNQPTAEELEAQKAEQEKVEAAVKKEEETPKHETKIVKKTLNTADSTALAGYKNQVGAFGFTKVSDKITTLENQVLHLQIANQGGQIVQAKMKEFVTYDSIPVFLIKDGNANFALNFVTSDNRTLSTSDLFFEPSLTQNEGVQVLSMKAKVSENQFLEYRYEMKPEEYLVDFTIRSQGLNGIFNDGRPITLEWDLKGIRHNKSVNYENRYTRLTYNHDGGKISKLSDSSDSDEESEVDVKWLSYRQHFFSSILAADDPFETVELRSKNLVEEESKDTKFTKEFSAQASLDLKGGELSENMHWYYGPTDA